MVGRITDEAPRFLDQYRPFPERVARRAFRKRASALAPDGNHLASGGMKPPIDEGVGEAKAGTVKELTQHDRNQGLGERCGQPRPRFRTIRFHPFRNPDGWVFALRQGRGDGLALMIVEEDQLAIVAEFELFERSETVKDGQDGYVLVEIRWPASPASREFLKPAKRFREEITVKPRFGFAMLFQAGAEPEHDEILQGAHALVGRGGGYESEFFGHAHNSGFQEIGLTEVEFI